MPAEYKQLTELRQRLEKELQKEALEAFYKECAKELAARFLAAVIPRTPTGVYPAGSGKTGGTLKRGWTGGNAEDGVMFAKGMEISKRGDAYEIRIENPVEYASYVEFGHRTRGHKGWVNGQFFMTITEKELRAASDLILRKKFERKLRKVIK